MVIHVFMDFEVLSKVEVNKLGACKYAMDPSTVPMMLAYGNDQFEDQWFHNATSQPENPPECPDKLRRLIEDGRVVFHAHNAGFEIAIWELICVRLWGWPVIARDRWHCTAARAAAANQPRSLDNVGQRVGLSDDAKKEKRGKELIKALCVPTKAEKTYKKPRKDANGKSIKEQIGLTKAGKPKFRIVKDVNPLSEQYLEEQGVELFPMTNEKGKTYLYFFRQDPKLFKEFLKYNRQDIVAERETHKRLPPTHELERPLWLIDLEINRRGIPVDLDLCRGAMAVYAKEVNEAHREISDVTKDVVTKTTQVIRLRKWVNERLGFDDDEREDTEGAFTTLGEDYVTDWLALNPDAPEDVRRALELRILAGGTAVSKYAAALRTAQDDHRCRDQILYYGATTTGRWSGKHLQPHNFKREKTLDEIFIEAVKTGDHATVETIGAIEGKSVFDVLKGCLRGIIRAEKGKILLFSDFAGIESRGLNWLVGNEVKLDLFRRGQDAYIHTALDVYKTDYDTIATWSEDKGKWVIKKAHSEKRQIGKACELGLGYGMGWRTFRLNAAKAGSLLSEEFAAEVVNTWRDANPEVPDFWRRIEKACRFVIYHKRKAATLCDGRIRVFWDRNYLCIQLPSGRVLRYYKAAVHRDRSVDVKVNADGEVEEAREQIYYLDGGKTGARQNSYKINTYGGKLCENIIQALCRDLLVHSMMIVHGEGIPIIFHVHDEIVTEIDEDDADRVFKIVHQAMETLPTWAEGLPLEAETQLSRRFTK